MQRSSLESQDWHHRSADQTPGLVAAHAVAQNSFSIMAALVVRGWISQEMTMRSNCRVLPAIFGAA